jgi:hypothetical protein
MLSRVLKALQQISVMTHNEIEALADFTPARVALQNQLCALQQQRGLGRVFLGSQLLQPPIEVFRDAEIHSHTLMVPERYTLSRDPRTLWVTADEPVTHYIRPAGPSTQGQACSLTNNGQRLETLFIADEYVEVEASWGAYQRMVAAYREPDRAKGREMMQAVINSLSSGVPTTLTELRTLARTLKRRAADVLAYFDLPRTSIGPTEAINGCGHSYGGFERPGSNSSAALPSASRSLPTTRPRRWRPGRHRGLTNPA